MTMSFRYTLYYKMLHESVGTIYLFVTFIT